MDGKSVVTRQEEEEDGAKETFSLQATICWNLAV